MTIFYILFGENGKKPKKTNFEIIIIILKIYNSKIIFIDTDESSTQNNQ